MRFVSPRYLVLKAMQAEIEELADMSRSDFAANMVAVPYIVRLTIIGLHY